MSIIERYELINSALQYVAGGVSNAVKGVGAAKAMLNTYVADYDSDVEDRNAEFDDVVAGCVDMTALAAPSDNFAKIVAAIKKYFE